MPKTAVLLVAYGAPDSLAAVEPFMRNLMGRDPSPELVEAARIRYLTIGGYSPLPLKAERVAAALERSLSGLPAADEKDDLEETLGFADEAPTRAHAGVTVPVAVGMLHWNPSIRDSVQKLADRGAERIVWASLSPFESARTTVAFRDAVAQACEDAGVEGVEVTGYHMTPDYRGLIAELLQTALNELPDGRKAVIFTAHSLPVDELGDGAYRHELEELSAGVARALELGAPDPAAVESQLGLRAFGGTQADTPWVLAYQSKGDRPGEWMAPDLDEAIDAVLGAGYDSVAISPVGFVLDHLETLHDLDVAAADKVLLQEREFTRAAVPNDGGKFIDLLAQGIQAQL